MNRVIRSACLMALAYGAYAPLASAGDVDISIGIKGEIAPGVYGRVDLTNRPAPPPMLGCFRRIATAWSIPLRQLSSSTQATA